MELDAPKYLYLLILLPLFAALFAFNLYWRRNKQREFGDTDLVKRLSPERSAFKLALKFSIMLLSIAALVIGLVNPKIGTKSETVKREGIDIVFAIDVSKSMLCEDVAPSRLDKSKQVVSQVINQLAGDRIGMVAYAGSAFPVLPVTTDYGVAKMFLQSMNPGMVSSQGTSLGEAIELSAEFLGDGKETSKLIILLSDGEDHSEGAENAAEEAKKRGIKIITVGIGTEKGGPIPLKSNGIVQSFQRDQDDAVVITKLNQESLQTIAKNSKGYVLGNNTKQVVDYVKNALETIERTEFETQQFTDYSSQFQWLLGIAFLLLVIDVLLLEKKTAWLKKMNLFNEKE